MSDKIQVQCPGRKAGRCAFASSCEWSKPLNNKEEFVCQATPADPKCNIDLDLRSYVPPRRWPKPVGWMLLLAVIATAGWWVWTEQHNSAEREQAKKADQTIAEAKAKERERIAEDNRLLAELKKQNEKRARQLAELEKKSKEADLKAEAAKKASNELAEKQAREEAAKLRAQAAATARNNPEETWFRLAAPAPLVKEMEILVTEFLTQQKLEDVQSNSMAKPDVLLVEGRKPDAAGYIAVEMISLGDQSRPVTADFGGAHLIVVARPDGPLRTQQLGTASKLEKRFAKEGYAVVVHPDNALKSVTGAQVTGILDRSITDWSVLGAPSGAIQLHLPLEGTSARQLLREAMGRQLPSGGTGATEIEVANAVFSDKNGAGLVPLRHVSQSRALDLILGDEGRRLPIPINEFSIATGDYPFTQTLFLRPASDSGNSYVPAFIQYVRSDPGQDVVATKAHLVDLRVSPRAIALPPFYLGAIPKEVVDKINLATTAQIPVVFRFESDRSDNPKGVSTDAQLVSASEDAMEKVVSLLFQPRNRDKIMLLFGHTDSTGQSGHNYDLSKNRATTIETLFKRKLVPNRIHPIGLSDQVPLDDNDTDPGRARNRRVEIFVADLK